MCPDSPEQESEDSGAESRFRRVGIFRVSYLVFEELLVTLAETDGV